MTLHGWATFAWQADYGQFYLIDGEDADFLAPTEITAEMEQRRLHVLATGLVYTMDCLQQHVRISIYDAEPDHTPVEPMSGKPWTQIETIEAKFPSRRFAISSPSTPTPLPNGPFFLLDTETSIVRVSWVESQGSRDDSVPVDPDIIDIAFWPG